MSPRPRCFFSVATAPSHPDVPCLLLFHPLSLFIILSTFTTSTPQFTEDGLHRTKRLIIRTFVFVQIISSIIGRLAHTFIYLYIYMFSLISVVEIDRYNY